jgi:twitching motility protein PilT
MNGAAQLPQADAAFVDGITSAPMSSMPAIEKYFALMLEQQASDLHLSSGVRPMLRVDGAMTVAENTLLSSETITGLLHEIMPERNRAEFEKHFDTDFAYNYNDLARFRCNVFMDSRGVGAVFRLIPSNIQSFEELGLPDHLKKFCFLTKGLVLVTGPTGSGKSTTLATMINFINQNRADHIITIEDPIEFLHRNQKCVLNQREVHSHTESFPRALRAALREDPNIVLIGEMRDLETVRIALETADTGHLVFATLHTSTAATTVERLINIFPADEQAQVRMSLAENLKGVVSQTLCKMKEGGRIAALEILVHTYALGANIRDAKIHQIPSLIQTGQRLGMRTLNDSLTELLTWDIIDAVEAYQKAVAKEEIIKRMATIPHCRSPRTKQPWTEAELIRAAEDSCAAADNISDKPRLTPEQATLKKKSLTALARSAA